MTRSSSGSTFKCDTVTVFLSRRRNMDFKSWDGVRIKRVIVPTWLRFGNTICQDQKMYEVWADWDRIGQTKLENRRVKATKKSCRSRRNKFESKCVKMKRRNLSLEPKDSCQTEIFILHENRFGLVSSCKIGIIGEWGKGFERSGWECWRPLLA